MTSSNGKKRVLVTGAAGTIGSAVRKYLGERYELHALTLEPADFPSTVANIADLDAILPAFAGMDAVVHLAASAAVETAWEEILPNNLIGTYNVYEAARLAGVERVVFASSNHTIGWYEFESSPEVYRLDDPRAWDESVEARPDSLYGVSKVYGEALGRHYVDRYGLRVFCLRIGTVTADDDPRAPSVTAKSPALLNLPVDERLNRMRCTWLSQRDCCQLIERCLDVEDLNWAVVYGISNNPRQFWSLERARKLLGYEPEDSAG